MLVKDSHGKRRYYHTRACEVVKRWPDIWMPAEKALVDLESLEECGHCKGDVEKGNHPYRLCPKCLNPQGNLPVHLRECRGPGVKP